jgi:ABC-type multidrug transport system permease subunit
MSYNSKRTITSIAAGVILTAAYIIYALGERSPAPDDLKSWAVAMLAFIGIGVAAVIVTQILFHIAFAIGIAVRENERDDKEIERILSASTREDEREKLINLKSSRVGHICAGVGFIAALVALAFGWSAVTALHIMFSASVIGSVAEGIVGVYFFEKGVRNE